MFEYAVSDFEAEVGFYAEVFGLDTVALTAGYALFEHPGEGFCLSFRRLPDSPPPATVGLKLLLMTTDLDAAERHLEETELVSERETREGSASQRVIHFESPGGVAVEIWEHAATRS
nr:VOC family protein [Tessaracoccus sp. OS52]